jgi:DNA-binding GntR family transcriptional regulator
MASYHPTGLEPAPGATLARHRVRDGIQRLILSGEYRPGQRLVQQELAARFGVAQSVVRESLLELQFCGLVEAVDNLGMFVSGLDAPALLAAYEIREMFEGLGARLCCERIGRADLRELTELAEENFRLGGEGDLEAMSALDRQFHYRMIQASRNELLARLTESYRVLGMFVRANRAIEQVRDEHLQIVSAIEANQPDEAERVARRHVQAARQAIERQVTLDTFVPHWVPEAKEDPAVSPRLKKDKDKKDKPS